MLFFELEVATSKLNLSLFFLIFSPENVCSSKSKPFDSLDHLEIWDNSALILDRSFECCLTNLVHVSFFIADYGRRYIGHLNLVVIGRDFSHTRVRAAYMDTKAAILLHIYY